MIKFLLFIFCMYATLCTSCSKENFKEDIDDDLCSAASVQDTNYIQKDEYKTGVFMNTYCMLGASTASMEWQRTVANNVSKSYKSYAVPGASWVSNANSVNPIETVMMAGQVDRLLKDKNNTGYYPDLITIMCGLNDSAFGYIGTCQEAYRFDSISDITVDQLYSNPNYKIYRESVYGAMRYIFEVLKKKFPQSCIMIMTPQQVDNATYNPEKIIEINEVINHLAKIYSIAVIDVYNESGINKSNINEVLDDIGLHPNEKGQELLTKYVEQQIRLKYVCNK